MSATSRRHAIPGLSHEWAGREERRSNCASNIQHDFLFRNHTYVYSYKDIIMNYNRTLATVCSQNASVHTWLERECETSSSDSSYLPYLLSHALRGGYSEQTYHVTQPYLHVAKESTCRLIIVLTMRSILTVHRWELIRRNYTETRSLCKPLPTARVTCYLLSKPYFLHHFAIVPQDNFLSLA